MENAEFNSRMNYLRYNKGMNYFQIRKWFIDKFGWSEMYFEARCGEVDNASHSELKTLPTRLHNEAG